MPYLVHHTTQLAVCRPALLSSVLNRTIQLGLLSPMLPTANQHRIHQTIAQDSLHLLAQTRLLLKNTGNFRRSLANLIPPLLGTSEESLALLLDVL